MPGEAVPGDAVPGDVLPGDAVPGDAAALPRPAGPPTDNCLGTAPSVPRPADVAPSARRRAAAPPRRAAARSGRRSGGGSGDAPGDGWAGTAPSTVPPPDTAPPRSGPLGAALSVPLAAGPGAAAPASPAVPAPRGAGTAVHSSGHSPSVAARVPARRDRGPRPDPGPGGGVRATRPSRADGSRRSSSIVLPITHTSRVVPSRAVSWRAGGPGRSPPVGRLHQVPDPGTGPHAQHHLMGWLVRFLHRAREHPPAAQPVATDRHR